MKGKEVFEELRLVFKGKTLDTILPPVVFVVFNNLFALEIALLVSIILAILIFVYRLVKKESFYYTIGGLVGVMIASGLAFLDSNANNFFLPGIIGNGLIVLGGLVSLFLGKPLAAYVSHLTRNWPLEWFDRKDVSPAYKEVTIAWIVFFLMRTILESYLYMTSTPEALASAEIFLGIPITIGILIFSYVYGIYRLRKLGGPGVDEFIEGKEPPYKGQTRGF